MIKSIRLLNWRSHADSSLVFSEGTNLMVGIMGAGKSSVLEGISFALFGTFPAIESRKMKLENIVRHNEQSARVILEFDWDGAAYRIEREIGRSKKGAASTTAELYRNNALLDSGTSAVTSYVKSLTGVDYDLFTRAIYSEQNNIDYFLTLGPGKRKEQMDELLGLDRFEIARASIVAVMHQVRSRRTAIEERFSREKLSSAIEREGKQSAECAGMEKSLADTAGALAKSESECASALARFESMLKVKEQADQLGREEIRLVARHEALRKELESKAAEGKSIDEKALAATRSRLESLQKERLALDASSKALDSEAGSLSKEAGSVDARIRSAAEAAAKIAECETELKSVLGGMEAGEIAARQKEAEGSVVSMRSEAKSLEREVADISGSLGRLSPGLSECPVCSAPLSEGGIAHVRAEKEKLCGEKKERIARLSSSIPAAEKENESLLHKLRRIPYLSERREALLKEASAAEALKARKEQLESAIASLTGRRKATRDALDQKILELESARAESVELNRLLLRAGECKETEKSIAEVRTRLAGIRFDEKAFEAQREAAERSRLEREKLLSSKKATESQARMARDMLRMVRDELSALRLIEAQAKELGETEEQLAVYKNALLETQTSLRASLADAINTAMNEIWAMLYPYRNYRALRLGVSEKDYVFEVDDGGGWRGLETVASGGERACAALALRVALAMVLTPKLSWLILDEPTHNLDSEAVDMLSQALQYKVPEVVKQTFIITHDEAFMGSEFASSYRLKRDKEHNGDTKVESL